MVIRTRSLGFLGFLAAISSASAAPRAPAWVVFAHGLGAPWETYETVVPLKRYFRDFGDRLIVARTPVAGSLEERRVVLEREILERVPGDAKIHLVGHSMGGLDARGVLHQPEVRRRVLSVTTLAAPHRGSPVADFVLAEAGRNAVADQILSKLFAGDLRAVRDLTREALSDRFNPRNPDAPGIVYASMGFVTPTPVEAHVLAPWMWPMHGIMVEAGEVDNDCAVSVESSRWGKDLGTFVSDHVAETSWVPARGGVSGAFVFGKVVEHLNTF